MRLSNLIHLRAASNNISDDSYFHKQI